MLPHCHVSPGLLLLTLLSALGTACMRLFSEAERDDGNPMAADEAAGSSA